MGAPALQHGDSRVWSSQASLGAGVGVGKWTPVSKLLPALSGFQLNSERLVLGSELFVFKLESEMT